MAKDITKLILFILLLVPSSCTASQSAFPETTGVFFQGDVDRTIEVFAFDGLELKLIDRDSDFIKKKVPVTQGQYFVLFFIKKGYIPKVKVYQAGGKDIKIEDIRLESIADVNAGFLVGAIFKPVYGGKIVFRKGIADFSGGMNITAVNDKGESYTFKAIDNGVFCIRLAAGKYKVFAGDSKKAVDVVIKSGIATIQNLQKGLVLAD